MKLRTREGSLRLRLTRSEVEALDRTGRVSESLVVAPGAVLSWTLETSSTATRVDVRLDGAALTVVVPASLAHAWCTTETQVGIEPADGASPRILIEKDWACLKPRDDEDDADAYPHPAASLTRR